ncbi:MAG: hypothetical protein GTO63_28295 [Anaerolineae bacterium]|nr:hypothetical protein [Anaerolineae bacterium]NIN98637.1 hypothetical protein [Anaerolineae bacterium]NIQ81524.1 hypothetical protein [Anaerolineae bacterium]
MLHLPCKMKQLGQAVIERSLSVVTLLFLLLVLLTESSAAAPLQQEQQCDITSPRPNTQVRGSVEIIGTARLGPEFQKYLLEYASAATPNIWIQLGGEHRQEKTDAGLEIWHTTALPDGEYLLRLTCAKIDGNYARTEPVPVRVANAQAAPTPTPEETPTPTPIIVLPTPTAAIIEQPAVIQRTPTATPVPGEEPSPTEAPEPAGTISFPDVGVFVRQFVFGAFVTMVIFLFVGVVFLLKRLI